MGAPTEKQEGEGRGVVPTRMNIAELVEIGRIVHREASVPRAGPGELVVKTRAVGLCGTDLKAFLRGHPYFTPPCVLGHEFTGTVAEVGTGVQGFSVGEAIVAAPYVECGTCDLCRRGLGELCKNKAFIAGALQEFLLLPRKVVEAATFRLPSGVGFAVGSLAEPVACVVNGIERASVGGHDSVLVVGGGPMGVLLALMAQSISTHVVVSEIAPARIDALRGLGLPVVDPSMESVPQRLEEVFGSPYADVVLIAVGARAVAEEALEWTAPGGIALLFGGLPKGERLTIDPFSVHYRETAITGSFGFRLNHFRAAVSWIGEHASEAAQIVTDTVPFHDVAAGFELGRRAGGLKTVVTFGTGDED